MPTLNLVEQLSITKDGFKQEVRDAVDLDGWKEVSIYVNVASLTFGAGGTTSTPFRVTVKHAARNRITDYEDLESFDFTATGNKHALGYQTQFTRFLRATGAFLSSHNSNAVDLEILLVPKN